MMKYIFELVFPGRRLETEKITEQFSADLWFYTYICSCFELVAPLK